VDSMFSKPWAGEVRGLADHAPGRFEMVFIGTPYAQLYLVGEAV